MEGVQQQHHSVPTQMSDSGLTRIQMSICPKRGQGEKQGETNTERERERKRARDKKRNKEKERSTEGGREGGRNYFTTLLRERCISWTLQDPITFEVKVLNHQMEDLALSFTINSLSSHLVLLQKNREAKSLLGFKDNGIEIGQEKKKKKSLSWALHWRKLTFPRQTPEILKISILICLDTWMWHLDSKIAIYSFWRT